MITGGNLTVALQHEIYSYTSENVFALVEMSYSWACMLPLWMDIPTVYLSMIRGRATRIIMFLSVGSPREASASLDFTRFQFRSFTMCTILFISLGHLKVADT